MLRDMVAGMVLWCWRRPLVVVGAALLLALGAGLYAASHLGLDTDESKLISSDLPFRRAEDAFAALFPGDQGPLVVVVDAPTQAVADGAARVLMARLQARPDRIVSVRAPPGTEFFRRNGLLYLPLDRLGVLADRIVGAQPLIGTLARDPSLRGLLSALDLALEGAARGEADPAEFATAFRYLGESAEAALAGRPRPLPWRALFGVEAGRERPPRALLMVRPVLDFGALVPGRAADAAIRAAARDLGEGVRVRLTGSAALADDNFATVAEGVAITTPLSVAAVCALLFWAVRSKRVVAAILVGLAVGLALTTGFAAAAVGTLNPISVAFAVMFVGIAVDFGIQFSIRIRDEQFHHGDGEPAVVAAAKAMAGPLSLAAVTTATGFLAFLPTAYAGVAQLGLIAGAGMLIALAVNLTVLPAMLALLKPPPAREGVGLPRAAPLDMWLRRHARGVVTAAALVALAGVTALPSLRFDFNPLNLQNPKAESVAAFRDLAADPDSSPYSIDVVAPSAAAAAVLAEALGRLPEVAQTITAADLVPVQQSEKLAVVADMALLLGPTLEPARTFPPPSPAETRAAMAATAARLEAGGDADGRRLAESLRRVLDRGEAAVAVLAQAATAGLPVLLDDLRGLLKAEPVTAADLPPELLRRFLSPTGAARIEVSPAGDMQDPGALGRFVAMVQRQAPDAVGLPVAIVESGVVVVNSFLQAGLIALGAIALLLGLLLRRIADVGLVLLPLLGGALATVVVAVAAGLAINFANIIALPLLLGIGVAFNIYFVVARRAGIRHHLQSSTSRAVLFSALTTGSAFGVLAVSPHLGTATMGLLLVLSLGLSVASSFLVLPAVFVMLEPREHP